MNKLSPGQNSDRPGIVSFGGGKGGVGRSTLCAEIARSLARHGERVLCVDAGWECPTLNTLLHADEPSFDLQTTVPFGHEESHIADFISETGLKNVWLATLAPARLYPFVRPKPSGDLLIEQLHQLDFDWILIDLPPGVDPMAVGTFILSDVPVLVTSPEPAAVRLTAQFLRAALYQAIGYHPRAHALRDDVLEMLYQQPLLLSRDTLLRTAPSAECRRLVTETIDAFEPYMVVNMVREGSERDLGFVVSHASFIELGVYPRYLGSVDYEDRRWFFNRRTTGAATMRGEEALSTDIEQLAKYLADLDVIDRKYPRPVPRGPDTHAALRIGLTPETGRNEVRQHCRRLWEGYRREVSLSLIFSEPDRRQELADQLEATYRKILTLPSGSFTLNGAQASEDSSPSAGESSPPTPRRHEVRTPPTPTPPKPAPRETADAPAPRPAPRPDPDASGEFETSRPPGEVIGKLRREHNMSLQELSLRTHIGIKYLSAIEDVDTEILPRPVYLRGYLREIARILEVDPDALIDQYFRFLEQA